VGRQPRLGRFETARRGRDARLIPCVIVSDLGGPQRRMRAGPGGAVSRSTFPTRADYGAPTLRVGRKRLGAGGLCRTTAGSFRDGTIRPNVIYGGAADQLFTRRVIRVLRTGFRDSCRGSVRWTNHLCGVYVGNSSPTEIGSRRSGEVRPVFGVQNINRRPPHRPTRSGQFNWNASSRRAILRKQLTLLFVSLCRVVWASHVPIPWRG